ncbi:MAG: DsbA family protein [Gammaproteobacteria bacterium]|nr:DsbA family protein [Gammaproteobacteria bacterium]
MKPVPVGASTRFRAIPSRNETASALGNTGVDVVSTQALIIYLEHACHSLMAPNYQTGEGSVGYKVDVAHLAPAFPGTPVEVEATLMRAEGRELEFNVSLSQDGREVMRGSHTRVLVDLSRFRARAAELKNTVSKPEAPGVLEFWFDFNSPWCFLAALRIGPLARLRGMDVDWRPVHLARLNARIGGRRPLEENAAFVSWYRQDLEDYAALQGVTVRYHPAFPLRPSRALRASLYAAGQGAAEDFVIALMRAYWTDNENIEDPDLLSRIGEGAGLDPQALRAATGDAAYKAELEANLEAAVDGGIFGLPTTVYRGKRYFGNDRLELLERHLDAGAG